MVLRNAYNKLRQPRVNKINTKTIKINAWGSLFLKI